MLFADYHTHPQGHRVRAYTTDLLQPWIDSAKAKGLTDIAFTDHDRYYEGIDFDVIEGVRAANPEVKIRAGIELDNDPVHSSKGREWIEKHWDKLDFVLGSVHFLDQPKEMFDRVPEGAKQFAGRVIDEIYADYFRRVREMAASGLVDCLAHIDLIKIHGHRSTRDVCTIADETLDFIRVRGLAIELSTAGWRKPVNELYPSDGLISRATEKGISFTTASDAHSHAQLGENFQALAKKMAQFGIKQACVYEKHRARLCAV